jgi:GT2 family glycosyltransferase
LQKQVELLKQIPGATVLCEATNYWSSWADPQKRDIIIQVLEHTDKLYHAPQLVPLVYPLGKGLGFCTCGLIIKKKIFDEIGGFDERFMGKNQLFEDRVFL